MQIGGLRIKQISCEINISNIRFLGSNKVFNDLALTGRFGLRVLALGFDQKEIQERGCRLQVLVVKKHRSLFQDLDV